LTLAQQAQAIDRVIAKNIRPKSSERWKEAELIWPQISPWRVLIKSLTDTKAPIFMIMVILAPLSIIGQFSYEGVVPLNFTGTQITQSQMTCYEMSVVNLILPNQVINGTQGLLTSAYPYVFLEISNFSMPSSHNVSLLYSNNPNATRATFVCSISDVNNPRDTRFIKISSDGAVQTLKFSPFDNLRFRISFPNGQTFETEKTDTLVPCDPDPLLQISVVLEIRRL
jgi:hypothetical protein